MPYFFYQGKRCFYTCSGVGPPLLFLHGNTASSQMFQFLLPFYTPCFHCILLDFLGSGRSQRMPELPPQLWIDQGRQAAALIRHLGLGPVFLVGTSGGAWAALNAGLEHPDLVRGIVADSFDGRTLHRGFDRELLEERKSALRYDHVDIVDTVAKISIVGAGMVKNAGVASQMFEALYSAGVNINMISTSEIKISVLVNKNEADRAVQAIHDRFFSQFGSHN